MCVFLCLSSGRVCAPVIKLLGSHDNIHITIASDSEAQSRELLSMLPPSHASYAPLIMGANGEGTEMVNKLVRGSDLVISLLPATMHMQVGLRAENACFEEGDLLILYRVVVQGGLSVIDIVDTLASIQRNHSTHHTSVLSHCSLYPCTWYSHLLSNQVAEAAIAHKKHMVTASYVSEAMRGIHQDAINAGISIVNEVGLDPGIDHMMIMKAIDDIHERGGKITELVSLCGGLPDPVAGTQGCLVG